jgi:S-adenosylmethionine hydrolase
MPVISLLTDFGDQDAYAAIMKGVILSINPQATIVDITHRIGPQDVRRAAYLIAHAFDYFPKETIHIIVVDPGVGGSRAIVALRKQGHTFLAPDNGVLTLLLDDDTVDTAFRVENSKYFLEPVSHTFHGRDIFAPVGAHLTLGLSLAQIGPRTDTSTLERLDLPKTQTTSDGGLLGAIVAIDRYGNLITNLDWNAIKWHYSVKVSGKYLVGVGKHNLTGLYRTYGDVGPGKPLALVGSHGCLEISVNRGNAAEYFGAKINAPVVVRVV